MSRADRACGCSGVCGPGFSPKRGPGEPPPVPPCPGLGDYQTWWRRRRQPRCPRGESDARRNGRDLLPSFEPCRPLCTLWVARLLCGVWRQKARAWPKRLYWRNRGCRGGKGPVLLRGSDAAAWPARWRQGRTFRPARSPGCARGEGGSPAGVAGDGSRPKHSSSDRQEFSW
jgi:hypothetical protein